MPKHFFFDLDGTLARSRYPIEPEHRAILLKLAEKADIVVTSGTIQDKIRSRLGEEVASQTYILAQNGNYAIDPKGNILWVRELTAEHRNVISEFVELVKKHVGLTVKDENDLVEDRGSQIGYSLIGHNEHIDTKEQFDPDHTKRHTILQQLKEHVDRLRHKGLEVKSAGTTTFDIYEAGKNKGFNCNELMRAQGWEKDECIYIGDALMEGGNDHTVVGVMPTKAVKNYRETYEYLSEILK